MEWIKKINNKYIRNVIARMIRLERVHAELYVLSNDNEFDKMSFHADHRVKRNDRIIKCYTKYNKLRFFFDEKIKLKSYINPHDQLVITIEYDN